MRASQWTFDENDLGFHGGPELMLYGPCRCGCDNKDEDGPNFGYLNGIANGYGFAIVAESEDEWRALVAMKDSRDH